MPKSETKLSEEEFLNNIAQLDALVRELEALPFPEVQNKVMDLLQTIDVLHRNSLHRLAEFMNEHGQAELMEQAANDTMIETLFQLYDLIPLAPQEQVVMVLEDLRPDITALGCMVELLDVTDGIVHLRLHSPSQSNAESLSNLTTKIETALQEGFSGFQGLNILAPIVVPPSPPSRSIIPLNQLRQTTRNLNRPIFTPVLPLEELEPGVLKGVEIDGVRVLLCQLEGGDVYAYHNNCPGSLLPLEMGRVEGTTLHCPWHQCLFDIRSGKRLDGGTAGRLKVIPVAVQDGIVQLALSVEPIAATKSEK